MKESTWDDALRAARKQTSEKLELMKKAMIEEAVKKFKEEEDEKRKWETETRR